MRGSTPNWAKSKKRSKTTPRPSGSTRTSRTPTSTAAACANCCATPKGARADRNTAQRKIAEYRTRLNDSTYSIYADTTQRFDRLLSFDTKPAGADFDKMAGRTGGARDEMRLLPLFKFTLMRPDTLPKPARHHQQRVEDFRRSIGNPYLVLSCRVSDLHPDTLLLLDKRCTERLKTADPTWKDYFERGVTQSQIKQYTNSVNTYSSAIEMNPTNPFLYLNRSTTRAEMIDFISSIDNSYQRITIDADPANRLNSNPKRTYSYDEAIADLNKAAKLYPEFAHAYYNRANLRAPVGQPAGSVRGLHQGHRTEPVVRGSLLQPRNRPTLYERHAQRVSRPLESGRTGYRRSLRNTQTPCTPCKELTSKKITNDSKQSNANSTIRRQHAGRR